MTRVQFLDNAVCISCDVNILRKDMNLTILPTAMGK